VALEHFRLIASMSFLVCIDRIKLMIIFSANRPNRRLNGEINTANGQGVVGRHFAA
jgi:hypothetical protein